MPEARNLKMILDRRIDGLLLIPYAPFRNEDYSDEAIRRAAASGVPSVAIDRYLPGITEYAVIGGDRKAARGVSERLIAAGSRRPAYLGFNLEITSLENRRRGFYDAVKAAGLPGDSVEELLLNERNSESSDISRWLEGLAESGRFPDAFMVSSDGLAQKLNWLLKQHDGRRGRNRRTILPMIARFGEDSPLFPTGMISALQPHEELGRRAAEMLFNLIAGEVIIKEKQIVTLDMKIIGDKA